MYEQKSSFSPIIQATEDAVNYFYFWR